MSDRRETNHQWYESADEDRMTITFLSMVDDPAHPLSYCEDEITVPAKYGVCETCDGKGKHVNPSIDAHGLSAEDFDEDPGFREDYFSGVYDQECNECYGRRVSFVVDESRCTPDQLKAVYASQEGHDSYERQCAAERRMGY
jgi:hypothetical protein